MHRWPERLERRKPMSVDWYFLRLLHRRCLPALAVLIWCCRHSPISFLSLLQLFVRHGKVLSRLWLAVWIRSVLYVSSTRDVSTCLGDCLLEVSPLLIRPCLVLSRQGLDALFEFWFVWRYAASFKAQWLSTQRSESFVFSVELLCQVQEWDFFASACFFGLDNPDLVRA